MSYFNTQYQNILFPVGDEHSPGFRNAQLGAIFAISSYFTLHDKKPAIVVMPTGSGKTSVIVLSSFMLRAKKVLVITPSALVRGQITDEFSTLKTLKQIGAINNVIKGPKVIELSKYLNSADEWNKINEYDVVISTPNCVFKAFKDNYYPPNDFFDLILIDEAHHSSANSWGSIINHFTNSKKIFFTATPFRRDKKEINGELIYAYPLSKAFDDGIFSELYFIPVEEEVGADNDLTLAKSAELTFNEDRNKGFEHFLFVRTNTIPNAKKLLKIYEENTNLKLKIIDSSKTYVAISKTISRLKDKKLDGIICVNMLGEGFDFPNLKIAAVHSPHKTLAATLQFIGRFVRTNATNIGDAKFLAIINEELEIEKTALYSDDIVWHDKIIEISEGRIQREGEVKKALNSFKEISDDDEIYEDLSIYNLNPYFHVKVYKVQNFKSPASIMLPNQEIVKPMFSEELNSLIVVTREKTRPRWMSGEQLYDITHNLFIVYYDASTSLLFIHSSIKTNDYYDFIVKQFTDYEYERISQYQINKVLADVNEPEFFSIGLANRLANNGETYKTLAGPSTQNALNRADGRLYSRGHIFGKGKIDDEKITIGYSSSSKIWSNRYDQIPLFIKWCQQNASKIVSNKEVKTNSAFDDIPQGKTISEFPSEVLFCTWNKETYFNMPFIHIFLNNELVYQTQLYDFEINVIKEENFDPNRVFIDLEYDDILIPLSYDFHNNFKIRGESEFQFLVSDNYRDSWITDYLNENPLDLYLTENYEMIMDHQLHSPPPESYTPYDQENIIIFDWSRYKTDIHKEFGSDNSIHEALKKHLNSSNYEAVIYDHGPGEIADFITISNSENVKINLYHVKGAKSRTPGSNRVDEVYEVMGQVIKSLKWLININTFRTNLEKRISHKSEKIIKNNLDNIIEMLCLSKRFEYELFIVQPGVSKTHMTDKIAQLLASCDYYVKSSGNKKLSVIGSA